MSIGDLGPYVVQVLSLNLEIEGSGFICHPDGYALTCWHVVEAWHSQAHDRGRVVYQGERLAAELMPERSAPGADLAVLKLTRADTAKDASPWRHLPLDVHWRVQASDQLHSFGYPTGQFERGGIPTAPKLQGLTPAQLNGLEVFPLVGLNMDDIDRGYSGAPVADEVTGRVIGLVHAKHHETQAFLIALRRLFDAWPELRAQHDVFEHIRQRLGTQAEAQHAEKVRNTPFIPLALECGVIPEQPEARTRSGAEIGEHGRSWSAFDVQRLLPPRRNYVLSADVGTGKTTFVYWLAAELVRHTSAVPLLASCQDLERLSPESEAELVAKLGARLAGEFTDIDREACFERARVEGQLVYLFDGLDQVQGKPSVLAQLAFTLAGKCPVLVTSRPSAVLGLENDPRLAFLRLQPFSPDDQRRYFGERYGQAKTVCALAPDLTEVPMLAYMVRELLTAGVTDAAITRTELYGKFLHHVVAEHDPNRPLYADVPDLSRNIQRELERVAFLALAEQEPKIQKVPFETYPPDARVTLDQLTAFGVVNRVFDRGDQALYFTHQSFQEFLAARHAAQNAGALDRIFTEHWHAKWAEVIRFLAGMQGESFLERLLAVPDSVIHADLLVAAYCAVEPKSVHAALINRIKERLWKLARTDPFRVDAIDALGALNRWLHGDDMKQLVELLSDHEESVREAAIGALGAVADRCGPDAIQAVMTRLRDDHEYVRRAAGAMLASLPASRATTVAGALINWLYDESQEVRDAAAGALGREGALSDLREYVTVPLQRQIAAALDHASAGVRISAAGALGGLGDRVDRSIHPVLVAHLQDADAVVRRQLLSALCSAREPLEAVSVSALAAGLKHADPDIRADTAEAMQLLGERVDAGIVRDLVDLLSDPDQVARWAATKTLGFVGNERNADLVRALTDRFDDPWDAVRYWAIESLRRLGNEAVAAAQQALLARMADEGRSVRLMTAKALGDLGARLDTDVWREIVASLEHEDPRARATAANVVSLQSQRGDSAALSALVQLLRDKDGDVRAAALEALAAFANQLDQGMVRQIAARLDDANENARFFAAETLGAIADRLGSEERHALVAHLKDRRFSARSTVVEALGRCGDQLDAEAIRALIACLRDKEPEVRAAAVTALASARAQLDPVKMADLIIARLHDEYRDVRRAATDALEQVDAKILARKVPAIAKLFGSADTLIRADAYAALWRLYRLGVPLAATPPQPMRKEHPAKGRPAKRRPA